jgi:WD40 repeat protein
LNNLFEIKFDFFLGRNKHASAVTWVQVVLNYVVSSGDDGTVKLWDLKTGDFIRNLVTLESMGNGGKKKSNCMIEKK